MLLQKALGLCELGLGCAFILLLHGVQSSSLVNKAVELMSKYPLIDGHNDLPLRLRILQNNKLSQVDMYNQRKTSTDITRLKAGHVGGQMFAAYVLCTAQDKDAVRLALEQVEVIRRICTEYPEMKLATSAAGGLQTYSQKQLVGLTEPVVTPYVIKYKEMRNTEKIACMISIEGGHAMDSSLPALRMFYQLGVRSMSLTHTCNTPWAESSSLIYSFYKRKNNSLTDFGKAVVDEMNRLGMLIDLSHTSWDTALAVLERSKAPVIFSHSSSYQICNHTRNVPDNLLNILKMNGGIIMVNFHSGFISCSMEANISHVADHFDHLKLVIGAEHIGIGGDYDGASGFPQGLEDVAKYPALIGELLRRNWSEADLAGVLRFNFLRVFDSVEKIRDDLHNTTPSEAEISFNEAHNPCRVVLRPPTQTQKIRNVFSRGTEVLSSALFWTVLPLHYVYLSIARC